MTLLKSLRWNVVKVVSPLLAPLAGAAVWPGSIGLALRGGPAITLAPLICIAAGAALVAWQSLRINARWEALASFTAAVRRNERDWRLLAYTRSAAGKLLLRQETLALGQDCVERDVQDLRGRIGQSQMLPGFLIGLAAALGLLGACIGLVYSLTDAGMGTMESLRTGQVFGRMAALAQRPPTAAGAVFAASLFGLTSSVLLGLMRVLLRGQIEDYMRAVRAFMLERLDARNRRFSLEATESVSDGMLARQALRLGELIEKLGARQDESQRAQEALQQRLAQACERDERVQAQIEARFEQICNWLDVTCVQAHDGQARTTTMENMLMMLFERGNAAISAMQILADTLATVVYELRRTDGLLSDMSDTQKKLSDTLDRCVQELTQTPAIQKARQTWNHQAAAAHSEACMQAFATRLKSARHFRSAVR